MAYRNDGTMAPDCPSFSVGISTQRTDPRRRVCKFCPTIRTVGKCCPLEWLACEGCEGDHDPNINDSPTDNRCACLNDSPIPGARSCRWKAGKYAGSRGRKLRAKYSKEHHITCVHHSRSRFIPTDRVIRPFPFTRRRPANRSAVACLKQCGTLLPGSEVSPAGST